MRKWTRVLFVACLSGALSLTAHAGPYIGASWGAYSVDESDLDDNDDLWKAFAGYTINDLIGIEGSWVDFNRAGTGLSSFEADGWGLSAVVSLPLGTSTLFAKAGQFWWDSQTVLGGLPADDDGNDPFFGAGVVFGGPLGVRLEWERYDVADVDVDSYSIGLQFGF